MLHITLYKKNPKLKRWVDAYIIGKQEIYPVAARNHGEWLRQFMEVCDKDITDITEEDVIKFTQYIDERYHHTEWARQSSLKALSCFMRYWRARGHRYLQPVMHDIIYR